MEYGYLSLLQAFENLDYANMWRIMLLTFIRFAPIVGLAPFLGAKIIPATARVALALALTFVFLPSVIYYAKSSEITDVAFVGYAVKELIIGLFLGYLASIPFFVAQSSGILIDFMRGSSMLMAQDPTVQVQSSSIGIMFNQYLIVLFYAIDGPFMFFDAIYKSFEVFPINALIDPKFFQLNYPFWQMMIGLLHQVFTLSIQLASPAIVAVLMAEMFLGIANRLAPQVQIAFLGMSLKSLLGLTLLWAGWFVILRQSADISLNWMDLLNKIVAGFTFAT